MPKRSTEEHFWSKVDRTGDCWLWSACRGLGYGRLAFQGEYWLAHRLAYFLTYGSVPENLDHRCRNRACVRPDHLRPTTDKQNIENHSGPTSRNKSGVRGVCWDKNRRCWKAQVNHNNRNYNVGRYATLEDAEAAVIAKRLELHTHNDLDRI